MTEDDSLTEEELQSIKEDVDKVLKEWATKLNKTDDIDCWIISFFDKESTYVTITYDTEKEHFEALMKAISNIKKKHGLEFFNKEKEGGNRDNRMFG